MLLAIGIPHMAHLSEGNDVHIPRERTEEHGFFALALLNMFDMMESRLGKLATPLIQCFLLPVVGAEAREMFYGNFDEAQSLIGRTTLRLILLVIIPFTTMLVLAHNVPEAEGAGFLVIVPVPFMYWAIQPTRDPSGP